MITVCSWTRPRGLLSFDRMSLNHMLLQAALLNERLATTWLGADVLRIACVFFHMIKHSILASLDFSAFGTNKVAGIIANVRHLGSDCLTVSHLRRLSRRWLRFTFFVCRGRLLPPTFFQPFILLLFSGRVVLLGTTVYFGLPFSRFIPGKGSLGAVAPDCISKRRQYFSRAQVK